MTSPNTSPEATIALVEPTEFAIVGHRPGERSYQVAVDLQPGQRYFEVVGGAIQPRPGTTQVPITTGAGLFVDPDEPLDSEDVVVLATPDGHVAARWLATTDTEYLLQGAGDAVRAPRPDASIVGVCVRVSYPIEMVNAYWTDERRATYWAERANA